MKQNCTPLRLVGYTIAGKSCWVATDRCDLTAEQVAQVYKLRWDMETFFARWNPAVEAQASDRAHRIGQERLVTV